MIAVLACVLAVLAQETTKTDNVLKTFVDAVVSLRQGTSESRVALENVLSKNEKWTLMDELQDQNGAECRLNSKMKRLNLTPILNKVLAMRHGKSEVPGHYLNGEDPRYDYSLTERGITARGKVSYTMKGRVGEQDFVFVTAGNKGLPITVRFVKGKTALKTTTLPSPDGTLHLHIGEKLKSSDRITMEISNTSGTSVAVTILNHNTRK